MQPSKKTKAKASDSDRLIGERLRAARLEAVISQVSLGDQLRVSYQQIQKWESGTNRITAAMLVSVANELGKPVAYFLADLIEGAQWGVTEDMLRMMDALSEDPRLFLEHYSNVTPIQRTCLSQLTRDLAAAYKHQSSS